MKKLLLLTLVLAGIASQASALTFQDKQDKQITSEGIARVVETGGSLLHETASDTSLDGTLVTLYTVSSGYSAKITSVGYTYIGTVTNVRTTLLAGGKTIDQDGAPVSAEANNFAQTFWLDAGETVQLEPEGYTAGDTLKGYVHGVLYKD